MKKIRIFSFPSHSPGDHVSGVDYPRVIQPMKFLDGYNDGEYKFEVTAWDGKTIPVKKWGEICKDIDIVYMNYTLNDLMFASMGMMAEMNNVKVVVDLDDGLWQINKDNTVYETYKKGSLGIATVTDILNYVDRVTCTNNYLKNVITTNTKKTPDQVAVFPNTVDFKLYDKVPEFKDTPGINIVHYGSSSHYTDLSEPVFIEGIDRIMKDYPQVQFLTVGSFFGEFKMKWGRRYNEEFGALNFLEWAKKRFPEVMAKTDIFVAPLSENVYNSCKSDIKRSEVATAKKPFVGQDIRQYREVIEDGKDGFLCKTADDWYNAIKRLIDSKKLRKFVGENGYKRVFNTRMPEILIEDYAKFFRSVIIN